MDSPRPHILILLSSNGHDPTEVAIPALHLSTSFKVSFATADGTQAHVDQKLLERGLFGRFMGASEEARAALSKVEQWEGWIKPQSWEDKAFDILKYDVIILPGGHDRPIRSFLESPTLHAHLARFWPYVSRSYSPSSPSEPSRKVVGAICHGVLCLAFTSPRGTSVGPAHSAAVPSASPAAPAAERASTAGQSILNGVHSTTLPRWMERFAWITSQAWGLGGYYRTYGEEGRWCADDLVAARARYAEGPISPTPFVCTDPSYRYVSARFPGDAKLFAQKVEDEVKAAAREAAGNA